jgi:hypothetical protein
MLNPGGAWGMMLVIFFRLGHERMYSGTRHSSVASSVQLQGGHRGGCHDVQSRGGVGDDANNFLSIAQL